MTARRAIVLLDDGKEGELPVGDTLEGVGAFFHVVTIPATSNGQTSFAVAGGFTPGAIVVFHDSLKSSKNLWYALPRVLEAIKERGLVCKKIEL